MSAGGRARVDRTLQKQIHPGWLSQPRSGVEILALKLGVSVPRLLHEFEDALSDLVEAILAHSLSREKERYLRKLDERAEREMSAAVYQASELATYHALVPDEDEFFRLVQSQRRFKDYLNWFNTDDWGCDEWFGFAAFAEPEDVRLQKWMNELLLETSDQEQSDRYVFLDAGCFTTLDEEPPYDQKSEAFRHQ